MWPSLVVGGCLEGQCIVRFLAIPEQSEASTPELVYTEVKALSLIKFPGGLSLMALEVKVAPLEGGAEKRPTDAQILEELFHPGNKDRKVSFSFVGELSFRVDGRKAVHHAPHFVCGTDVPKNKGPEQTERKGIPGLPRNKGPAQTGRTIIPGLLTNPFVFVSQGPRCAQCSSWQCLSVYENTPRDVLRGPEFRRSISYTHSSTEYVNIACTIPVPYDACCISCRISHHALG